MTASAPAREPVDWGVVKAMLRRDLGAIARSKALLLPMLFLPTVLLVLLPLSIGLAANGKTVLISDYFEYYRLAAYLSQHSKRKIGIVMGAASLSDLFDEKYYSDLEGGILESFGRLFKNDLSLYIYPFRKPGEEALTTVETLEVAPALRKLYGYLVDKGVIQPLDNPNESCLSIFSRDVLKKIKANDPSWEAAVPPEVAELIKRKGYFGYRKPMR